MEIWKDVVGYEGLYLVSNEGRVKTVPRWVTCGDIKRIKFVKGIIRKQTSWKGYFGMPLRKDGKSITIMAHRIVAQAFIPNPNNLPQVNHINGIKTDNRLENLEWVTASQNIRHADDIGLRRTGERCHHSKLTNEEAISIFMNVDEKTSQEISEKYGITIVAVCCIWRGKTYRRVTKGLNGYYSRLPKHTKLTNRVKQRQNYLANL